MLQLANAAKTTTTLMDPIMLHELVHVFDARMHINAASYYVQDGLKLMPGAKAQALRDAYSKALNLPPSSPPNDDPRPDGRTRS